MRWSNEVRKKLDDVLKSKDAIKSAVFDADGTASLFIDERDKGIDDWDGTHAETILG